MRKFKRVLYLHSSGLNQRDIARSCLISQSTVSQYLAEAETAGLRWPLPEDWDDGQIERKLNPHRPASAVWRKHDEPDWPAIQGA